MPAGRPLKFKSPLELKEKIEAYFTECAEKNRPLTITGLAIALDTNRETLVDYENNKGDEFSDTIKRSKLIVQNYAEEQLFTGKNVAGVIFNLKNNYGWRDKTETDITTGGDKITGEFDPEKAAQFKKFMEQETQD